MTANAHREQKQAGRLGSFCKNSLLIQLEDSDGEGNRHRLFGAAVLVFSICARSENVGMNISLQLVGQIIK